MRFFGKKTKKAAEDTAATMEETPVEKETTAENNPAEKENTEHTQEKGLKDVAPKEMGKLDMIIAFDTTGSMACYIEDVRRQVSELVPRLFKDNDDLRLGIVAFGDYCDMKGKDDFGKAYQSLPLTNNENDLVKFIRESKDTNGGDGDEFYELVIKKTVEETDWREGSTRSILLISDARPHPLGYTFENYVVGNQIDWRLEAKKAADKNIKIDTVTINPLPWYKELSEMTGGVSVPFYSSHKTADMIYAGTIARSSFKKRAEFDTLASECKDEEMKNVFNCFREAREKD